ncbi:hypothetical protein DFJ73DRAFT_965288 [Zopfochytrium polystomum]|nr:hypothetical protein DFJ73DRAFT_965288 [Zopfochytrium polystomum]
MPPEGFANQQKVLGGRKRSSTQDGGGAAHVPNQYNFAICDKKGLNGFELCSSSVVMAQPNLCADPKAQQRSRSVSTSPVLPSVPHQENHLPAIRLYRIAISPLMEKVLQPASGREWGALGESQTHDLRMTVWRSTCATRFGAASKWHWLTSTTQHSAFCRNHTDDLITAVEGSYLLSSCSKTQEKCEKGGTITKESAKYLWSKTQITPMAKPKGLNHLVRNETQSNKRVPKAAPTNQCKLLPKAEAKGKTGEWGENWPGLNVLEDTQRDNQQQTIKLR